MKHKCYILSVDKLLEEIQICCEMRNPTREQTRSASKWKKGNKNKINKGNIEMHSLNLLFYSPELSEGFWILPNFTIKVAENKKVPSLRKMLLISNT